jgi:hypothetical protein
MSNDIPVAPSLLGAVVFAFLIAPSAAQPTQAAEAGAANPPAAEGTQAAEPERPPGLACSNKALSGTGPGFDESREHSEDTAKAAWLEKAKSIYSDATWETAKELNMTCVKQGLYSKCFARAIPCGVQKSSAAAEPPAKSSN